MTEEPTSSGMVSITTVIQTLLGLGLVGGAGFGGLQWNDSQVTQQRSANELLIAERDSMREIHSSQVDKLTLACKEEREDLMARYDAVFTQCRAAGLLKGGVIDDSTP